MGPVQETISPEETHELIHRLFSFFVPGTSQFEEADPLVS